jgi:hypothetical protein
VAGADTWQEEFTVAVTLNEAVRVAAMSGREARADASRPKANTRVLYFMDFSLFEMLGRTP